MPDPRQVGRPRRFVPKVETLERRLALTLFSPPQFTEEVPAVEYLTVADVNSDSFLDLVLPNGAVDQPRIDILYGFTDLTFWLGPAPRSGLRPKAVAVGDFNEDGVMDLASADHAEATTSIVLGYGDGYFTDRQSFASGPGGFSPFSANTADVDGDGHLDLLFGGFNSVSVLRGTGDGRFYTYQNYFVPGGVWTVTPIDMNGDGALDIVSASEQGSPGFVNVLIGNGDGTFRPNVSYNSGVSTTDVAVGDFNGDGWPDVATANQGSNTVAILLNFGDGRLGPARQFAVSANPGRLVAADFNLDGFVDLVASNSVSDNLSLLLGQGDGTFQPQFTFPVGRNPFHLVTADFNSDGWMDLVVLHRWPVRNAAILLNLGGTGGAPGHGSPFDLALLPARPTAFTMNPKRDEAARGLPLAHSISSPSHRLCVDLPRDSELAAAWKRRERTLRQSAFATELETGAVLAFSSSQSRFGSDLLPA